MHARFFTHALFCAGLLAAVLARVPPSLAAERDTSLTLWYDKPAERWEQEASPIGNAFMGAMIFGGVTCEQIQFNEETLWIGDEKDTGAYQAFGDVFVEFTGRVAATNGFKNYRRSLDISRAIHTVSYEVDGVHIRREAFASYPAKVLVFRFTADKPGVLSGAVKLTDAHQGKIVAENNRLTSSGSPRGYVYHGGSSSEKAGDSYGLCLQYEAQVALQTQGGTLATVGDRLVFTNADSLTLVLGAGTDFVQDGSKGWKGEPPHAKVTARVAAAMKRPWDDLLAEHVSDYQSLFNRVTLDLGAGEDASLTTNIRLENLRKQDAKEDLGLEQLLFQYGRYLMIASSRPGSLPANLQGKWNNSDNPPWRCDYHTDINIQMNYWPVEVANLSECFQPYADWLESIRAVRTEATRLAFNRRGWLIRGESGLFGGSTWDWVPGASAWLLQNSYDHYRFTLDRDYLRACAYPAMKEVCAYWVDSLEALPDGTRVTPVGLSPEQGPKEKGITFDQEWVWDLFTSTIEASATLGVDADFRKQLTDLRAKLLPLKIGKWGQLQEWMVDRDDPKNTHRHVSHLVALFPGRQISPLKTPALAEAARVSLNARGDKSTGWSTANKINLWARLHDGDRAHMLIQNFLHGCIMPNLFDTNPPFQIDGNFGYTAGVCEMLMQSHLDEIDLLPALPKAWPAGTVTGLRARGGFKVDVAWKDGVVTTYRITAPTARLVKVRVNGTVKTVTAARNVVLSNNQYEDVAEPHLIAKPESVQLVGTDTK